MINIDPRVLADNLDLWHGTQWFFAFPAWAIILMPLILAFVPYVFARCIIEFRPLALHKQYPGFWPGELFYGLALGLAAVGMLFYASPVVSQFWHSTGWNLVVAVVSGASFILLWVFEIAVSIKNRGLHPVDRDPKAYTMYQIFTPSSLAHRWIMFLYAYLFMKVGVVALFTAAVPIWLKCAMLGLILAWMYCVKLDNTRKRPNLDDIHPRSNAWFGAWFRRKPRSVRYPVTPAGDHTIVGARYAEEPVSPAAPSHRAPRRDVPRPGPATTGYQPAAAPGYSRPAPQPAASGHRSPGDLPDFTDPGASDGNTRPINPGGRRPQPRAPRTGRGGELPDFTMPGE